MAYVSPPPPHKNMVSSLWLMVSICYLCTEVVFYLSTTNFQKLLNLTIYFWQLSIEHNYYFWKPRWKLYTTHWTSVIVNHKKASQDKFCNAKFTLVHFASNVYKKEGEKKMAKKDGNSGNRVQRKGFLKESSNITE